MPFAPIDITSGLAPGFDAAGTTTSVLANWETDASGTSKPRTALSVHALTSMSTDPVVEAASWGRRLVWVTQDSSSVRKLWYQDKSGTLAVQVSDSSDATTQLGGVLRPVFAFGATNAFIAGGSYLLNWDTVAGTISQVSAGPRCTHVAALGQRLLVNDTDNPGWIRWSDIGEGVWRSWPAANASNADARPDNVVGVYENGVEAFVFGETTTQVYGIGSDALFPFEAIVSIDGGLGAPYAVTRKDGSFYLLDERRALVRTDGRSREYIDAEFGRALRGFTVSDCFAYYDSSEQRQQVVLVFPTTGAAYVRDLTTNRWAEKAYYSGSYARGRFPVTAATYWPATGQYIYGSSLTAGGLLKGDTANRADMGGTVPIICERQTGWHDHGAFEWKRSRGLRVVLRRGTATQNATPAALEVRVQNDGDPWTDWEQVSIGGPDEFETVADLRLGGVYRRRRYHIRYAGSDDTCLVAAFDDVETLGAAE